MWSRTCILEVTVVERRGVLVADPDPDGDPGARGRRDERAEESGDDQRGRAGHQPRGWKSGRLEMIEHVPPGWGGSPLQSATLDSSVSTIVISASRSWLISGRGA